MNPGMDEVCDDGMDNNCDGIATLTNGTSCFMGASVDTSAYNFHADGTNTETMGYGALYFGGSYGPDDTPDLFVGSEDMVNPTTTTSGGALYVRGAWSPVNLVSGVELYGATANGAFGASVVSLGDMAGDTDYDDLLVGSPGNSQGYGEVYIIIDPFSTSPSAATQAVLAGQNIGEEYGHSLASLGLTTGSNTYVVGAPSTQTAVAQAGYVEVIDPTAFNLTGGPALGDPTPGKLTGAVGDGTGTALLTLNLDAADPKEILIGAPYANSGQGVVYVAESFSTKANHDLPAEFLQLTTSENNSNMGYAMAACDLDGDGVDEVFIGAPGESPSIGGTVYVFDSDNALLLVGGPNTLDITTLATGMLLGSEDPASEPNHLGASLHCEHDLDNSGASDLVVADPHNDVVYVLYGPRDVIGIVPITDARGSAPHTTVFSGSGTGELGSQITTGLVDDDITADLCVTAPAENSGKGILYCFYGMGF